MSARLLVEMTRAELAASAAAALLLVPLGATEQHGPHLPAGTDSILVERVARDAAARIETTIPVVLAPTLSFGSSAHHLPFGATLSLATDTYLHALLDLGRSAAADGFRRLFFLNGHGGNHELAQIAARDLALELPLAVGAGSFWAMAYQQLRAAGGIENVPGHAGAFETSLVMAVAPKFLRARPPRRKGKLAPAPAFLGGMRAERHGSWQEIDGFTDDPSAASAKAGRAMLKAAVATVAHELGAFYRASGAARRA